MKIQGAIIKEQGVTFAIMIVKRHILSSLQQRKEIIETFTPVFSGIPLILMAQDHHGTPTYSGRKDIVNFLAKTPMSRIPWKEYIIN